VVLRRDGRREVLVELAGRGEEEEPVDVAEDGELLCLLEQSVPALVEGGLPLRGVLDPLYLAAPASHLPELASCALAGHRDVARARKLATAASVVTRPAERKLGGTAREQSFGMVGGEAIGRGGAHTLLIFCFKEAGPLGSFLQT
jgi:hypothetical protein